MTSSHVPVPLVMLRHTTVPGRSVPRLMGSTTKHDMHNGMYKHMHANLHSYYLRCHLKECREQRGYGYYGIQLVNRS